MLDLISSLLLLLVPAVMLIDDARLETEPTVHYRKCDSEVARRVKEILGR